MNLNELEIELIEKYVEGRLEGEAMTDFNTRMKSDKAFADEVTVYQQLMKGVESYGADDFMTKVGQWENEYKNAPKQEARDTKNDADGKVVKLSSRRQYIKYMGIAAAVALALFAGSQLFTSEGMTTQRAFNENFEAYQDVITDRGSSDVSTLKIGMGLYNKGTYDEAAEALEKYITQEINNDRPPNELLPARFYLANAQLAEGNIESAVNNFKIVSSSENSFQQQSDWFLALAFLKTDNLPNTKAQLNLILQNKKHSYAKKAGKLMEVIKKLEE